MLRAPSPGRLVRAKPRLAYPFASDAPGACPEPVEGTGARSAFKGFPRDPDRSAEVRQGQRKFGKVSESSARSPTAAAGGFGQRPRPSERDLRPSERDLRPSERDLHPTEQLLPYLATEGRPRPDSAARQRGNTEARRAWDHGSSVTPYLP